MAEKPEDAEKEKIFTISLSPNRGGLANERARHAMNIIRRHVSQHMKAKLSSVWIDPHVNEEVWSMGGKRTKAKLKVKAIKFEDGLVEVSLPTE